MALLRAQPPVLSPLPMSVLWAPITAALGGSAEPALERRIQRHLGAQEVLLVDSGTSALRLAIEAATDGGRSGPVALPAYCCYDVATSAIGAGARVQLYDIEPGTLSPDLASLARCISDGAAAVVVAHLYGLPADMPRVNALAARSGVVLIEDAAQALGAGVGGRTAGAWGGVSVLSFGRGKGVTGGGGGALAALSGRGRDILDRARRQVDSGGMGLARWLGAASQFVMGRPSLYGVPLRVPMLHLGETRYRAPRRPTRMATLPATVLTSAWDLLSDEVVTRRENAARLSRSVGKRLSSFSVATDAVPSYLRLPLLAEPAVGCAVAAGRWRALGVAHGYPLALTELPALRDNLVQPTGACPGARELAQGLITLPTHSLLKNPDLDRLERWLAAVADGEIAG